MDNLTHHSDQLMDNHNKEWEKVWFFFQGTQHKGPLTVGELRQLFDDGVLKNDSLVWREGLKEWDPLNKIDELKIYFSDAQTPPNVQGYPSTNLTELTELTDLDEILPPPVPEELRSQKTRSHSHSHAPLKKNLKLADRPKIFSDPTRLDLPPLPELMEMLNSKSKKKSKKFVWSVASFKRWKWWMALGLFTLILLGVYTVLLNDSPIPKTLYLRGLNPGHLEKLEQVLHTPFEEKSGVLKFENLKIEMALSVDGKTIFLTSNLKNDALLQMTLTSKPNQVLSMESMSGEAQDGTPIEPGDSDVIMETRGKYTQHVARFTRMKLIRGSRFLPGRYRYKVKGKVIHPLNKEFPFLLQFDFFKNLNDDFMQSGDALIYAGSVSEFEKKLGEFQQVAIREKIRPLEERIEKIGTLKEIIQKTIESLSLIFSKANPKSEMKSFESFFIKEISPMLQGIMNESLEKKDHEVVEQGKKFGEEVTALMTYTQKEKTWQKKEKAFSEEALKKIKSIPVILDILIEGEKTKILKMEKVLYTE